MSHARRAGGSAVLALPLVLASGCASTSSPTPSSSPSAGPSSVAVTAGPTVVQHAPSNLGQLKDKPAKHRQVAIGTCDRRPGRGWLATGTAVNPSKVDATQYRITILFVTKGSTVQDFGHTVVKARPGGVAKWRVGRAFEASAQTSCVLAAVS